MKTEELLTLLARGAGPVVPGLAWRRLLPAVLGGTAVSLLAVLALRGTLPAAAFLTRVPWLKLGYAALLGAPALLWLWRLARPGADEGRAPRALLGAGALVLLAGLAALLAADPGQREQALLGSTWAVCPRNVMLLSLPALAGLLLALRGLAPTRLRLAGAAAGLVAGTCGAMAYGLSCPESSVAFVAAWYSVGLLAAAALGAALGPRVLRW